MPKLGWSALLTRRRACGYAADRQHAADILRRRGIGEQLVRRFLAWARDQQVAGISVAVAPENEPALALYRKLGFRDQTLILTLSHAYAADAPAAARG
jgi:ribosomal protein S18 acetylase RimI-like enzyme